jgi:hypothetical protein
VHVRYVRDGSGDGRHRRAHLASEQPRHMAYPRTYEGRDHRADGLRVRGLHRRPERIDTADTAQVAESHGAGQRSAIRDAGAIAAHRAAPCTSATIEAGHSTL